jgi:hypothetical protein
MRNYRATAVMLAALLCSASAAIGQTAPAPSEQPFEAGKPLGVTIEGKHQPMSSNVKVYGAIVNAESCVYDPARGLILVVNRGATQKEAPNDGFVSLVNHDGSVHTARWIGASRAGLVLNHPFGSAIHGGYLFLADLDGGTADGTPQVAMLRSFDMKTGAPVGEIRVPDSPWLNDIAVAADGTVYASQTGSADGQAPMRIYRIGRDGSVSVFLEGEPLLRPNGIAMDPDGNVVVVNMGDPKVMTFSPAGKLLKTEHSAQAGSDGLVILPDGTKYVSSVVEGGVSRIRPGRPAELIATGIPNAASMCLDTGANQLVIPMNPNNAIALVKLR